MAIAYYDRNNIIGQTASIRFKVLQHMCSFRLDDCAELPKGRDYDETQSVHY